MYGKEIAILIARRDALMALEARDQTGEDIERALAIQIEIEALQTEEERLMRVVGEPG